MLRNRHIFRTTFWLAKPHEQAVRKLFAAASDRTSPDHEGLCLIIGRGDG